MMQQLIRWTESGRVPDALIRIGIRRLLRQRLAELAIDDCEEAARRELQFLGSMRESDVALVPEVANEQHYEVPTGFFLEVLGPRLKYSSCLWDEADDLAAAEDRALAVTAGHADLADGQSILELGCGWGSLTLWMAENFPRATITAVSNSSVQREHIESQAARRGLDNVLVITADMNGFAAPSTYDRVVSVEMFEHMRNWPRLLGRVASWLGPGGRFFMHVFCHASTPYPFVDRGPTDWMTRHFFGGGMMPSDGLALLCQDDLRLARRWRWSGQHYSRTLEAWLAKMDASADRVRPILAGTYGDESLQKWWMRWRLFFLACSELFAFNDGQEWFVAHYLFDRRGSDIR